MSRDGDTRPSPPSAVNWSGGEGVNWSASSSPGWCQLVGGSPPRSTGPGACRVSTGRRWGLPTSRDQVPVGSTGRGIVRVGGQLVGNPVVTKANPEVNWSGAVPGQARPRRTRCQLVGQISCLVTTPPFNPPWFARRQRRGEGGRRGGPPKLLSPRRVRQWRTRYIAARRKRPSPDDPRA